MKKLKVDLRNCYGIKSLSADLDFDDKTKSSVYSIYAPNGAMKSSLARTFKDLAAGADSSDRIFPDRKCSRSITDEAGKPPDGGSIFVVSPYDEELGHSAKTSTLLVNNALQDSDLPAALDAGYRVYRPLAA